MVAWVVALVSWRLLGTWVGLGLWVDEGHLMTLNRRRGVSNNFEKEGGGGTKQS